MMRLGCHSYSLRGHERAHALAAMRAAGFERAELWAGHAPYAGDRPQAATAERVLREARDAGVALEADSIGGVFGLPLARVRQRLTAAVEYAGELGIGVVTGILDRGALATVDALCQAYGLRFAAENHWYTELARPEDYAALDACSPAVGIALDTGHFRFLGCDLADVARRLGGRTLTVHLKAVRPVNAVVRLLRRRRRRFGLDAALPAQGDELAACLATLATQGYDGLAVVEHEAADGRPAPIVHYRRHAETALGLRSGRTRVEVAHD